MRRDTLDMLRVWACVTGLAVTMAYFVVLALGMVASNLMPMLVAAVGGFELHFYLRDLRRRRTRDHG